MKIYRGVQNILFSKIDPLFKNPNLTDLTYGRGTSYATAKDLAQSYGGITFNNNNGVSFGWVLSYDFNPRNMLNIDDSNYDEEMGSDAFLFIEREMFKLSELSNFLVKNNYDSAFFDAEYCCDHIFLTELCQADQLVLSEVELYVEDKHLINLLKSKNYYYDGKYFSIPLIKEVQKELDEILESYLG